MKMDLGLLLLRLFFGGCMLFAHGWSKLTNFSNIAPRFPDPIGFGSNISLALAVFSEVFCAILLMVGLLTRIVSIPLAITMAVAVFVVHASDPFNKMELGLLYLIVFVFFAMVGPGKFSIDRFIFKNKM